MKDRTRILVRTQAELDAVPADYRGTILVAAAPDQALTLAAVTYWPVLLQTGRLTLTGQARAHAVGPDSTLILRDESFGIARLCQAEAYDNARLLGLGCAARLHDDSIALLRAASGGLPPLLYRSLNRRLFAAAAAPEGGCFCDGRAVVRAEGCLLTAGGNSLVRADGGRVTARDDAFVWGQDAELTLYGSARGELDGGSAVCHDASRLEVFDGRADAHGRSTVRFHGAGVGSACDESELEYFLVDSADPPAHGQDNAAVRIRRVPQLQSPTRLPERTLTARSYPERWMLERLGCTVETSPSPLADAACRAPQPRHPQTAGSVVDTPARWQTLCRRTGRDAKAGPVEVRLNQDWAELTVPADFARPLTVAGCGLAPQTRVTIEADSAVVRFRFGGPGRTDIDCRGGRPALILEEDEGAAPRQPVPDAVRLTGRGSRVTVGDRFSAARGVCIRGDGWRVRNPLAAPAGKGYRPYSNRSRTTPYCFVDLKGDRCTVESERGGHFLVSGRDNTVKLDACTSARVKGAHHTTSVGRQPASDDIALDGTGWLWVTNASGDERRVPVLGHRSYRATHFWLNLWLRLRAALLFAVLRHGILWLLLWLAAYAVPLAAMIGLPAALLLRLLHLPLAAAIGLPAALVLTAVLIHHWEITVPPWLELPLELIVSLLQVPAWFLEDRLDSFWLYDYTRKKY